MDSPSEYLSDNDSINENYESEIEDVTDKITAKKEKPMKLALKDDGDEDEDDDMDDDDEDEDDIEENEDDSDIDGLDLDEDDENYTSNKITNINDNIDINISEDSDDDYDDSYFEKIDSELKQDYIMKYHSNLMQNNYDEIETLSKITGINNYGINDELHKTVPILTKYEKARVLGLRAKQIENGSLPLIELDKSIIDPYLIAVKELEQKKIPFIIKRPLPNGACEYWKIKDLELLL
uniref:DNA-directed RNA polymerase n=1 Tax=viral metagenome TaxID=1070528 RepID=A0A6C0AYQ9_9ZZZZ|tara:strand:- start:184 stop:894 length:711 start_codon:yes stop_codon:yes gene_type:complete